MIELGWTIVGICIAAAIVLLIGWCEDKFEGLDDEDD